jgi:hypothetical protein
METGRRDNDALLPDVITREICRCGNHGNDPEYCRYKKRLIWNQYKQREKSS